MALLAALAGGGGAAAQAPAARSADELAEEAHRALFADDPRQAIALFDEALRRDPERLELRLELAQVLGAQGLFARAEAECRRVLERRPAHAGAWRGEAAAILGQDRYLDAAERLTRAVETLPGERRLAHALARLLATAPDPRARDGARALELALRLWNERRSSEAGETLAMAYAESGELARAVALERGLLADAEAGGDAERMGGLRERLAAFAVGSPWRAESGAEISTAAENEGLEVGVELDGTRSPAAAPPLAFPPGTSMAERLRRLAEAGRGGLLDVAGEAARLRRLIPTLASPRERLLSTFSLAHNLLLAGETEEAIALLEGVRAELRRAAVPAGSAALRDLSRELAVAYLRLGEQENCVAHHGSRSCLLPIDASARHRLERGSRGAIRELLSLLAERPSRGDRWLLNLAYMTVGGYPDAVPERYLVPPRAFEPEAPFPRFPEMAGLLGVDVLGTAGSVAIEDFDRDGFLDLLVSAWGDREPLRFFRNDGGGGFVERTSEAGLDGEVGGLNVVHADYDDDGYPDVLVLRGAWRGAGGRIPNSLLHNERDGRFRDVTVEAGLLSYFPTQTAGWADYDGDGRLDLFVGNESTPDQRSPCQLYRNRGDGTFVEVAAEAGVAVVGFVKGVAWGDYDRDGRPDLFLSRFREPNLLFHNEGPAPGAGGGNRWDFREVSREAGTRLPFASFATWFFDYDNDGWLDLLVAPYSGFFGESLDEAVAEAFGEPPRGERARLFRNLGDGRFADVAPQVGLDRMLLAMGAGFGDLDGDGFLDVYFGTGEPSLATLVPNRLFRNDRGERFLDVTAAGGFGHLQKGHGIAFGDLDNDGDEDVYAVMGGAYPGDAYQNALFVNPGSAAAWVALEVAGTTSPRSAIGARLEIVVRTPTGRRSIFRTVGTGGSFGSSSLRQEVGLGDAAAIERVRVTWPGATATEDYRGLELRRFYRLEQGRPHPVALERPPVVLGAEAGHSGHRSAGNEAARDGFPSRAARRIRREGGSGGRQKVSRIPSLACQRDRRSEVEYCRPGSRAPAKASW